MYTLLQTNILPILFLFLSQHTHTQHDPDSNPACVPPTSAGGKYIMYAFATDGTHPNNDDFSPCSRTMMNAVIADRGQTGTSGMIQFLATEANNQAQ